MNKLLFLLLVALLSSCSITKKATTAKTNTYSQTESDSVSLVKSKTDTRVTETIDTVVTTLESRLEGELTVDSDLPFVLEDENQKVTIDKGKVTGIVKAKKLHVKGTKLTESKAETVAQVKENKKSDQNISEKNKGSEVTKTGVPWWLWLLLILVGIGLAYQNFKPKLF
jgi:hypothetical protein